MATSTDLADHRRLDAEFDGEIVTHVRYQSNPHTGQRRVRYEETWRRGKFLGQGGFATVWLEENTQDKKKLRAVKRILKHSDASMTFDPIDEAVVMSVLSHSKNDHLFVNFHGWYETHDSICLAMEYIQLGDFDSYLRVHGPLQDKEASSVVEQLLEGLVVIHKAKFIHRDLKPGNILIQHTSPWWVKIADFGISRQMKDFAAITFTGAGSRGYQAPEVEFNERTSHTTAVDMWSLGCVTYKLLTNRMPFKEHRDCVLFCKTPDLFYQDLDALSNVSEQAKVLIRALMVPEPSKRATAESATRSIWLTSSRTIETTRDRKIQSDKQPLINQTLPAHSEIGSTDRVDSVLVAEDDDLFKDSFEALVDNAFSIHRFIGQQATIVPRRTQPVEETSQHPNQFQSTAARHSPVHTKQVQSTTAKHSPVHSEPVNDGIKPSVIKESESTAENRRRLFAHDDVEALRYFTETGDLAVVKFLLEQRSGSTIRSAQRTTALERALFNRYEEIAVLLINSGAEIDSMSTDGSTFLYIAISYGCEMVAHILLDKGANLNATNNDGATPLHGAVVQGWVRMVERLIEGGAKIDAATNDGVTPLLAAVVQEWEKIVETLLDRGANVNAANTHDLTPLHIAADSKSEGVLQILLDRGAKVNAATAAGKTPLHLAARKNRHEIVLILLKSGANADAFDKKGYTPLTSAKKLGHSRTVNAIETHIRNNNQLRSTQQDPGQSQTPITGLRRILRSAYRSTK